MSFYSRRRRIGVSLALIACLTAACAGPKSPLNVGIKEVPGDVALGGPPPLEVRVVPIPPVSLPIRPRTISEFVAPKVAQAQASPQPCPTADPRLAPVDEAFNTATLPPRAGAYLFRTEGSFDLSGPNAARGNFPELSPHLVKNVYQVTKPGDLQPSWFRFDVEASMSPIATTTTTFNLVPERPNASAAAGLYIARVRTVFGDGSEEDFRPNFPGLLLLPFPALAGQEWTAQGADPRSGMAMVFHGRVEPKARVDACGVPLDSIPVHLDGDFGPLGEKGVGISPLHSVQFVSDYSIGTQFGGLILQESVEIDREFSNARLHQGYVGIINRRPELPTSDIAECDPQCLAS